MTPFFVVDRPMSLNIIKTFFANHPGRQFGLMSHALVSGNFRSLFASFPCQPANCWLCQRKSADGMGCNSVIVRDEIRANVQKIVDCGIFSADRQPPYAELFDIYEAMGADYGVMKDVLGDARRTVESAKRAVDIYSRRKRTFRLVLVAQGKDTNEYLRCSEKLCSMGVGELAVGGLLNRKVRSARYSSAGPMQRMDEILTCLRGQFPERWLFVLGCYHPKRHQLFEKHGVFGSDYKGWIFNYRHRFDQIAEASRKLAATEAVRPDLQTISSRAALREQLGRQAAELRIAYATTKNSSAKEALRKAEHREKLLEIVGQMELVDRDLVRLRADAVACNGLPQHYKEAFGDYQTAVRETEQNVRVTEVHRYLAAEILPKLTSSAPAVGRSGPK